MGGWRHGQFKTFLTEKSASDRFENMAMDFAFTLERNLKGIKPWERSQVNTEGVQCQFAMWDADAPNHTRIKWVFDKTAIVVRPWEDG
jgi:hypothetical protein